MTTEDLAAAVRKADEDVVAATRTFLAENAARNRSVPFGDVLILDRQELLLFLGYLTSGAVRGTDLEVATKVDDWVREHDLTEDFKRYYGT